MNRPDDDNPPDKRALLAEVDRRFDVADAALRADPPRTREYLGALADWYESVRAYAQGRG